MKKTMQQILSNTPRFSSRAAYFSGRGAITCDLNYDILSHIHDEIEKEYGKGAAKEMVKMVDSMDNCNATDFINNCYALESMNWKWKIKPKKSGVEISKNEDGSYNEASGMATMIGLMFGDSSRNETPQIKNRFLMNHGVKIKSDRNMYGYFSN